MTQDASQSLGSERVHLGRSPHAVAGAQSMCDAMIGGRSGGSEGWHHPRQDNDVNRPVCAMICGILRISWV
ncbi:hypothetical protein N9L68_03880 [bacterium]|nr:hypothetical protein [bacterium]